MLSHLLPLLLLLVCPLGMAAIMLGPGRCAGSGVAPGTARDVQADPTARATTTGPGLRP